MKRSKGKNAVRLLIFLTVCGGLLLAAALCMFLLRYRWMEQKLDQMLTESLTAHTVEAGEGAGYLIHYAETMLMNANLLIEEEPRTPEKGWTAAMAKTLNLVDDRMELSYVDRDELADAAWGQEEPELLRKVLAGEKGVSGLIAASTEEPYVVIVHPVEWESRTMGVLQARINAHTLLHQGQDSTFFHSVHSVISESDGRVVCGSIPEVRGYNLVELGRENGITQQKGQAFLAAYEESETGFFTYDTEDGRCYVAWASAGFNGWRVVQFSRSPNVRIERTSVVQTGVMLASLAVCAVLLLMIRRQRARLEAEKLRYDTLAQFKDTLIFEYDCQDDSLEFTTNALETLALADVRLEQVTEESSSLPIFHPDDIANVRRILREGKHMQPDQVDHDRTRLKKRNGEYSWYRSQYKAVFSPEGEVTRVIGTLTDISMQIDREQELRNQAQRDPLTGLYNRAGIKLINTRLEQISRGVLFMMDLDDFKYINDTYGHAAGDQVLTAVARILEETFRTDDIVARVGGDEFVAFLSGSDSRTTAEQKAQELLEHVRNLNIEGIDARAGASIGVATAPTCGRTYEELSSAADEAMYQIKKSGKGGYILK